jgi:deazaflavin-dependent oxidoreductase (nitroreductase family)
MPDQNNYNRQLIEEFRATRSQIGGPMTGRPLLLLTTKGAKSGKSYTTPIMYMPDGEDLIVFASNMGAATHPDWYHNLVAHPEVTVEVGSDETFDGVAVVTEGAERQRLWTEVVALYPFFTEHQAKITRQIPVIALKHQL